ncbi:hypothetical protein COLO4_37453 [Corchorus olitorius]|uniref:Uncharacterized protein n=1 Tax=Corchorus olitorius TaxID=93759 RepID=A0A1R3G1I7_9ROSI|nr:hypothetical protein COLO4_37453 [Corchorus olitorius]
MSPEPRTTAKTPPLLLFTDFTLKSFKSYPDPPKSKPTESPKHLKTLPPFELPPRYHIETQATKT